MSACSAIARFISGAQWPSVLTAQPCTKSRYRLPAWSSSQEP
ncbi:Uncharacterised protein [Bordetella pertussis]|nr:Uncharacterised protein [Bordetella pertussis]CFP65724.1 Uncharacterised protein [Bordetella pertussis]CFW41349.1 Uncharacterised protein [Bordetella pertussis]